MIRQFLFTGLMLLLSIASYAQSNGSIKGKLKGEDGEPISFANIQIKGSDKGTSSDTKGEFKLDNIAAGEYVLIISAIGYEKAEQPITVKVGETNSVNIVCKTSALELQSVTVTAEKREDELQKVPLSVTAVDSRKIEALQISNVNEIGRITPNFRTYDDGGGFFPLVSTRGIITIDANPIVGVYVDDVPLFNTSSFPSYFGDIERIEILKGPQGTLYGRNSIGGVMNIVSKKPTNYTRGFVTAGYGNLNQYEVQAGISAPIVKDKLFFRINGGTTGRDGYIENTFLNNTELLGRRVYNGNVRLTYLANDKWTFTLNSGFENRAVNAYAFIGGFGASAQVVDSLFTNQPYKVSQNTNGLYTTNISNNAFKAGFANDKFRFDAITAYQFTRNIRENDDFDFSQFDLQSVVRNVADLSTISQEFRIGSNTTNKFSWLGGLYLYSVSNKDNQRLSTGADNAFFAPDSTTAAQYPFERISKNTITQNGISIFGQASCKLTNKLTATGGLRYEIENSSLSVNNRFEQNGNDFVFPALGAVPAEFDKKTQFGAFSPKINLAYQAKENILVFANVARGYRPGGVNPFVFDEAKATFNPEFSWNYEAGIKNKLWKNRAKLNATVFYIEYKDQQLFNVIDVATFNFGRENIGNSRSYGAELETEVLLAKGLSFVGNIGYLKTEFTDFTYIGFTGSEINNKGKEQIMSPQWSGNVGLNYAVDLSNKWKANVAIDYQYQSDIWFDPENTAKQTAYGLLNSRVAVGNKRLEFALWGKNISDVTYLSYGYSVSGSGIFASYGLPRTFGASVTAKF
ncbi:MAG: TonB-dependent receptor [Chloroflexia bacterium]|nr:TonB-dependent receptor [Chloroflexia bacterium]